MAFWSITGFVKSLQTKRPGAQIGAEIVVVSIGIALAVCALAADRQWLDRHFLPPFFVSRSVYVLAAWFARVALVALGAGLVFVARPRIARFVARVPSSRLVADVARVLLAVALALGTSEWVLRLSFRRSSEEQPTSQVPYRQRDQRLGWVFVPSRTGRDTAGGRI